jgi:hypothetical protein
MRWLLQNAKDRFRRGLKSPGKAAARLAHHLLGTDGRFLALVAETTPDTIHRYIDEPSGQLQFASHLKGYIPALQKTPDPVAYLYAKRF